jgi:hypothetical protein
MADDPAERPQFLMQPLHGRLHVFIACDWGEEVDLARAAELTPAELHRLPRTPRTPSSIQYVPSPLRIRVEDVPLDLPELGSVTARGAATLFDFGGVSVSLQVDFVLASNSLLRLAAGLTAPEAIEQRVKAVLTPVFEKLRPAIREPGWSDLSEEYFVFQFSPQPGFPSPCELLERAPGWIAGLLRMDSAELSAGEVAETLRSRMSYGPADLVVVDWAAGLLIDTECDETLETIAFANLQLLEFRQVDRGLDQRLSDAYRVMRRLSCATLPFWRTHSLPLRDLGQLKVDANEMVSRTRNVLKLIGDQYLARLHQLIAARFHLDEWGDSVHESIKVLEGNYQVLSEQSATYRAELLEWMIVLLIVAEIVSAWL